MQFTPLLHQGESTDHVVDAMLTIGIDASRNRSGGAIAHVRGLLSADDPRQHRIGSVHLWAHDRLLDQIQGRQWLHLHPVRETSGPISQQIWWQYATLPKLARNLGIDLMFNTDAGSVCPFPISATLSQDMLSFEPGEMRRYSWSSRSRLRLEMLKVIQLHRLRHSTLTIFLTEYARDVITRQVRLPSSIVIPHGVDSRFFAPMEGHRQWPVNGSIRCLYVSNVAPYKHQWHVVEAIARLRDESGYDLKLRLVGAAYGAGMERLTEAIREHDPQRDFVELIDSIPNAEIANELQDADLFVFASSCENLPITLLEAMASGVVICSSDRGPMPEILGTRATYFDPEKPESIVNAVRTILEQGNIRERCRADARKRVESFTWEACSAKTWTALEMACRRKKQ